MSAASAALHGRRAECQALDELLAAASSGLSGVLVVHGEAGIGKTALLDSMSGRATGFALLRSSGAQSEMVLAFAGLQQLCSPLLGGGLDRLPAPQRDALGIAFGLRSGHAPDLVLVGLAVLGLLSEAAAERPVLCLVDDAQWLDRASLEALAFIARRLSAESVALVIAVREQSAELRGLPDLAVGGLGSAAATALLASVFPGPLDEEVRDRIVAETRGNPLALLELPRGQRTAELAGGFGVPGAGSLSGQIEESFRRRVEILPPETQLLLLLAAAEPIGDPVRLERACGLMQISESAWGPAEVDGLLVLAPRVRFRHPLARSAVYRAASPGERQRVHRALAEATDPAIEPDRRAWHRAQAASGPDEAVAQELERSASRAQARGGLAAAAAFLERALLLTPDPARRAERALAAAHAAYLAGSPDVALELLAAVPVSQLDDLQRARADLVHGRIAFARDRGREAAPLLLEAARKLEPLDVALARETYLDALWGALFAGDLAGGGGACEVAVAARATLESAHDRRASDLLLAGLVTMITDGHEAGTPALKRAHEAIGVERVSGEEARWLWLACQSAIALWDDETWHALTARWVQLARDAGALSLLAFALTGRIGAEVHAGDLAAAAALAGEVEAVSAASGSHAVPYGAVMVAAWQGREALTAELVAQGLSSAVQRGEGMGVAMIEWANAVLHNGLSRYAEALQAARRAAAHAGPLDLSAWGLIELVEAAGRTGTDDAEAASALARLTELTRPSGTDWARGIEARSRALLSAGPAAEDLYREAIERLGRTRIRSHLARAHLVYGEWLRRERRRVDARGQLRLAHAMLESMGADAFAQRAARELLATGETARKRSVESRGELTAQEAQIARLAREGLANAEIATRLFISARTVEYHLHKVFVKLGISSRGELRAVLGDHGDGSRE